jgi:hypothetical protein
MALTVLIVAQGKIVYYDFGGKDEDLRAAIKKLGPEYASLAPRAHVERPDICRRRPLPMPADPYTCEGTPRPLSEARRSSQKTLGLYRNCPETKIG